MSVVPSPSSPPVPPSSSPPGVAGAGNAPGLAASAVRSSVGDAVTTVFGDVAAKEFYEKHTKDDVEKGFFNWSRFLVSRGTSRGEIFFKKRKEEINKLNKRILLHQKALGHRVINVRNPQSSAQIKKIEAAIKADKNRLESLKADLEKLQKSLGTVSGKITIGHTRRAEHFEERANIKALLAQVGQAQEELNKLELVHEFEQILGGEDNVNIFSLDAYVGIMNVAQILSVLNGAPARGQIEKMINLLKKVGNSDPVLHDKIFLKLNNVLKFINNNEQHLKTYDGILPKQIVVLKERIQDVRINQKLEMIEANRNNPSAILRILSDLHSAFPEKKAAVKERLDKVLKSIHFPFNYDENMLVHLPESELKKIANQSPEQIVRFLQKQMINIKYALLNNDIKGANKLKADRGKLLAKVPQFDNSFGDSKMYRSRNELGMMNEFLMQ